MIRQNNLMGRAAHYLRHRLTSRALILMYHRIASLPADPQLLSVIPEHFAEQLQIVRRYARPLSLQALIHALENDRLPRRAVVVTFDDGYADNFTQAKPILERYDIPATVFVTAGHLDCKREFWWDELERLLLRPGALPETLSVNINGSRVHWKAEGSANYSEEDARRFQGWHIEQANDPSMRHALYRCLYLLLHAMPDAGRRKVIKELQGWAGLDSTGRQTHRTLSTDEVVQLADGGLVEIGAHTVHHPPLADLTPVEQHREIAGSKRRLEEISGRPVRSFAYPHGSFTQETASILRQENFSGACSSEPDAVRRSADPLLLPRVAVRDWDGEEFARWLKGWLWD